MRRHFALVSRFFRRRVSEGHADLIQRTFLGCVESRDRVAEPRFACIAGHRAAGALRSPARSAVARSTRTTPPLESQGSPSRVLDDARQQRLLFRALRRLPIELQLTLELHYWEQLKVEEVARVLEIPGGTVKSRLARARTLLREAIGACEADPELRRTTSQGMDAWLASMRRRREGC
ncbi:MAG: sigma-70 family RNA polymerase sigma factor [Deltaproteobacteria bacterium]|nr:sigma-70 family RNA polymerase sigma factor [Deltaproteobacteria bacterium]